MSLSARQIADENERMGACIAQRVSRVVPPMGRIVFNVNENGMNVDAAGKASPMRIVNANIGYTNEQAEEFYQKIRWLQEKGKLPMRGQITIDQLEKTEWKPKTPKTTPSEPKKKRRRYRRRSKKGSTKKTSSSQEPSQARTVRNASNGSRKPTSKAKRSNMSSTEGERSTPQPQSTSSLSEKVKGNLYATLK